MAKRKPSIVYQTLQRIDSLKRFGQSKHEEKMRQKKLAAARGEKWNPAKVEGIYSMKTCDVYKEHAVRFAKWVRDEHGIRLIENVTKEHMAEYLKSSMDKGNSAWTVRTEAAALAKVYGTSTTEIPVVLPSRSRENIVRSREERAHDKHFSERNHKDMILFNRGVGLRRHELQAVRPQDVYYKDHHLVVWTKGKGGREREVRVVKEHEQHVLKLKQQALEQKQERIFEKVVNRYDCHADRRAYAAARYKEIEMAQGTPSGETYNRRDGIVFDRYILREVSQDLGHSRVDVVARNYLD